MSEEDQIKVSGDMCFESAWFPSAELREFIEHDIIFGNQRHEYPTPCDIMLDSSGALIRFTDEKRRQVTAAVIAESGAGDKASKWRVETYRYKDEANAALELSRQNYHDTDEDCCDDYEPTT